MMRGINYSLLFLSSFVLSFLITPIIRKVALRFNIVSLPKLDRWHKSPTAVLGGIGIFLATIIPVVFLQHFNSKIIGFLISSIIIFLWGVGDDLFGLKPHVKLLGQIITGCVAIYFGIVLKITPLIPLNILLTIIWIVGITNAFNLLDNMDGLSCGIAAIATFMLFLSSLSYGGQILSIVSLALCGAALGFLPYNFNPARIFMGDSGSMFLGFSIAAVAITKDMPRGHIYNLIATLIVPIMILGVPIFDTTFVMLLRKIRRKKIFEGGKDHISHRLVTLGLSERKAVLLMYAISALFGFFAIFYSRIDAIFIIIVAVLALALLIYFGMFLAEMELVDEREVQRQQKNKRGKEKIFLNTYLFHKRRFAEVAVDFMLICVSYYLANILRFEGKLSSAHMSLIADSLPWIIPIKLLAFFYFGLYRDVWRYISIPDLISIFKAVTFSSVMSVVVLTFVFRFSEYSRVVFIIDWLILLFLVLSVRVLTRLLEDYFASLSIREKNALIIGAGDIGELLIRQIKRNKKLNYNPIGFIDDDIRKVGCKIHGIPVLGTREDIPRIVADYNVKEIFIAIPASSRRNMDELFNVCKSCSVVVREFSEIF